MQSTKAPDFLDTGAVSRSRSPSIVSSDSQFSRVNLVSPPSVTPSPAFISSSAASDIISADQEFNAADFVAENEETGAGATALVTPAALSLLNGFLDNLLFNILASSKSTQLACIRPAMADVLKPRLAKEVVSAAEEELSEFMGGAEDEQTEFRGGQEPGGDFDLIRSWKLTRLRCMVYTRLGDMEEDDEDEFIAQDSLGETDGAPRRFTSHVDNITPAASIFLTSIIEYIGERALVIAGETSRSRLSAQLNNGGDESSGSGERKRIDRLVVEDLDMEKLALNATLGRLWRTWRQRQRRTTLSRTLSRESFRPRGYSMANSRKSSIVTIEEPVTPSEPLPAALPVFDPATVPLPMSDYDVQEIEVPGYIGDLDGVHGEVQTMEAVVAHKVRPRSLMVFSSPSLVPKSPGSANSSPVSASAIEPGKFIRHVRTRSLPNGAPSPDSSEDEPEFPTDHPSPTTSEKTQLETMYEDDESAEYVDAAETTPGIAITTEHDETASFESAAETSENARMSILLEEEEETPAVSEMIASLRATAQDEDATTDQSNSARVSIVSLGDRPNQKDPEVIEGTGLCEKPKLTSTIHRPKRQTSRDVSLLNGTSISGQTSDSELQAVAESKPPMQGVETTPAPPAPPIEAITSYIDRDATNEDQSKPIMTATASTRSSEDYPDTANSSQSLSPDMARPISVSGISQRSKSRPRPAPLEVAASNRSLSASASASTVERAAVQRMSRPSISMSSSIVKSRRSGSFGSGRENMRPVTAGSTTSQVSNKLKGIMGRPQGDSSSLRMRSSSETSRASGGSGDSVDDIADLDKLINSDETIHYTLTPRSVREMTFPDASNRAVPRSETAGGVSDLAEFLNTTAPPGEDQHRPHASVSSRATGEMTPISHTKSIESPKHIPLTTRLTNMSSTSRSSKIGQARDARVAPSDSTRDFADFMRSTGPASGPYEFKTSISAEGTRPVRPPSNVSTTSRGNRPKLQARSAETKGFQTSDLIDFIREGPPMPGGAHRIPRTVAPFRNTIDSDDLLMETTTSSSFVSTGNGSTPNKSLTSLGSRTGLLDSNRSKPTVQGSAMDFDEPKPVRKQRRAPDPYAIDDDDDDALLEELLEREANPKPRREEESLMDFLRDAPPPPEEPSQPFAMSTPASNGASGMKARLLRTSQTSLRTQTTPMKVQSNYSAKVGQERNNGTMPSISNRKTDTGDLADFLRNTGPPPGPMRASSTPMGSKPKDGGISRFFTRRKKVEA
ncbi:uncharacterized protein N7500_002504 [Penicillium coprophilum]|uniref:uncharacterized protein n=1 Tax=Penicillium coprophilum TaxID=36646 RepID=UPI00239B58DA|nr:uncharacterized protein N7500_002504 [Penicillium coprophilum]KAJ5169721.1 hypothetical protein N7500_002504 [Penicillium coprophilum]